MRNTITRTFVKNVCTCVVYANGKMSEQLVNVPADFNTDEKAEKYIRKNVALDGKLAAVDKIEKVEQLRGMDESKFMQLAKVVDARSKDTRDCITKNVVAHFGMLVYMDKERKLHEQLVRVNDKRNLDKQARELAPNGCKGITIENVHEQAALYVMDEETFIANSKPMIDHQHYING